MLDEITFIEEQKLAVNETDFYSDELVKRAIVRSLEIIGEATKKVSPELKSKYPDIDWKAIAGTRDRLIHDYVGVDYEIVWDIMQKKIPHLENALNALIKKEGWL